jgi:hypothetical protein
MIKKCITFILIFLILINGMGCYSYHAVKMEDAEKIDMIEKAKIRTFDDKLYILTDVTIQGSEVKGKVARSIYTKWLKDLQGQEIVISFKEIREIEVREYNKGSTTVAIILGVGILGFMVFMGITLSNLEK